MRTLSVEAVLSRMKDECIFKNSEFMDKIILMDNSIYQYYKKYYNKNIFLHPIKLMKYLKIKRSLKKEPYKSYIDNYKNNNSGWYKSIVIPKDKKDRTLEIVNYFGKQCTIELNGYGFHEKNDNVEFGWICWVQRWRFVDNKSNEIENVRFKKKK